MKKIIASACAVLAVSFASVVAQSEETETNTTNDTVHSDSAAPSTTTESTTQKSDDLGNKMTSTTKWKNMKTCTDSEGVTYYHGKKGFENCVAQMKKSAKKDQMSGVNGESSDTKTDTGNMNSGSSDTSSNR